MGFNQQKWGFNWYLIAEYDEDNQTWLAVENPWTSHGALLAGKIIELLLDLMEMSSQPRYQPQYFGTAQEAQNIEKHEKKTRSPLSHFYSVSNSIQFICSSQEKCRTGSAWYLWRNISLGKNTMAITGFAPLAPLASCPKSSPSVEVSSEGNKHETNWGKAMVNPL